jgi:multicomponent Na+:H+ antiporter subunit G
MDMTVICEAVLVSAVAIIWLATCAWFRLETPLQRMHAVTMVNVVGGALIVTAAFLSDGVSSRSLKCLLIWLLSLAFGALLAQVSGRALYLRDGERR